LGSDKDTHIRKLFGEAKNTTELQGFVYEALRMFSSPFNPQTLISHVVGIDPPFKGVFRVAQKDVTISSVSIKKNERVFLDIASASLEVKFNPFDHSIQLS
jgi:cytochrome P450